MEFIKDRYNNAKDPEAYAKFLASEEKWREDLDFMISLYDRYFGGLLELDTDDIDKSGNFSTTLLLDEIHE